MADQPPQYTFSGRDLPPPSYDDSAAKAALAKLTPSELEAWRDGIAKALSDRRVEPHLQSAASYAVASTEAIEAMFLSLTVNLTKIDGMKLGGEAFEPKLAEIKKDFRKVIAESKNLATEIASYGERFDDIIAPYCLSTEFSRDQKLAKIHQFISRAEYFSASADGIVDEFRALKTRFTSFVGTFSSWAKGKEAADTQAIKALKAEIDALDVTLNRLESAITVLQATIMPTIGITAICCHLAGPVAPLVFLIGGTLAALEISVLIRIIVARNSTKDDLVRKRRELSEREAQLGEIKSTRSSLERASAEDVKTFAEHITALSLVWRSVHNDAQEIQLWLQRGAKDVDKPQYLRQSATKAVSCYSSMALYLRAYANGVKDVGSSATAKA